MWNKIYLCHSVLCFDFDGNKSISSTSVFQFHAYLPQFYTMASGGEDTLVDADEADKGVLDEKIAVNFASKEQLMSVTGIGKKLLVQFCLSAKAAVTLPSLCLMCWQKIHCLLSRGRSWISKWTHHWTPVWLLTSLSSLNTHQPCLV